MNNTGAKYAPKSKTYSRSMSLQNRISIAIGVTNGGYEIFFGFIYSRLGIDVSPRMKHYFKTKDMYTEK